MDPRCEPTQFLGPGLRGTLKNAGGRATPDAVRSILVLRSLIKKTEKGTVAVVHHTGKLFLFVCGPNTLADPRKGAIQLLDLH